MTDDRLQRLTAKRRVVVCAGAGGVGKTTIAAALSLAAARRGRRVLCLTIDPARRLADSLGLSLSPGVEVEVKAELLAQVGAPPAGTLSVAMLDPKQTFDELVNRHASSPAAAERILQNQFYRHVSTSLAGTQSYMAMEKVLSVLKSGRYDLIVLDTPPTSEALDFLDAPERLVEALDSPAMRWLVQAFQPTSGFSMRLLARGVAALLRTMGRLTGRGFLEDMAAFVSELNELFGGFKERAAEVSRAFRAPDFGYLLVAAPTAGAVEEARFFSERLRRLGLRADALVLNRVHPAPVAAPSSAELQALLSQRGVSALPEHLLRAQADEHLRAQTELPELGKAQKLFDSDNLWLVPVMAGDVRGLSDLAKVSRALSDH
ncbi:MAG TPA: ArsA-related P-loop ATPase [Polyangiaceae bacterium]|nr:ArsA-related P-loop ATPase [Polyangiaceae bacterium]